MKTTMLIVVMLILFSNIATAVEEVYEIDFTIYKNKYTLDPENIIINNISIIADVPSREEIISPQATISYNFILLDSEQKELAKYYYVFSFINEHTGEMTFSINSFKNIPYHEGGAILEIYNQENKLVSYKLPAKVKPLSSLPLIVGIIMGVTITLIALIVFIARRSTGGRK